MRNALNTRDHISNRIHKARSSSQATLPGNKTKETWNGIMGSLVLSINFPFQSVRSPRNFGMQMIFFLCCYCKNSNMSNSCKLCKKIWLCVQPSLVAIIVKGIKHLTSRNQALFASIHEDEKKTVERRVEFQSLGE